MPVVQGLRSEKQNLEHPRKMGREMKQLCRCFPPDCTTENRALSGFLMNPLTRTFLAESALGFFSPSPISQLRKVLRELLKDRLTVSSSVWETRRWLPDSHLSTEEKGGNELNFQSLQGKDTSSTENSIWMLPHWRELTSDSFRQEHKTFLPLSSNPSSSTVTQEPLVRKGVEKEMRKGVESGERTSQ